MSDYTQEWLCRQIVENTHDAIIFADITGVVELWNRGAEEIFGYSAEEALGKPLDLIIPEKLRQRHWEGYSKVMATGHTRYGNEMLSVPAIRKDGGRISIEFTVTLVSGPSGEIIGSAAIIRDVTKRWQEQKTLRDRLAALEAESGSRL